METTVPIPCVADRPRLVRPAPLTLLSDLHGVARRLQRSVPDLTLGERQFLKDFQRNRHPMTPLDRLVSLSARSPLPHHRHGLEYVVRAHVVNRAPALRLVRDEVLDGEDHSNSAADVAVRRFIACPSEPNRQAAREALEAQKAHTQLCLDWLNASPTGGAA